MIDEAIAFAATAHAGQKRKYDGLPYIVHPIEVMEILWAHGVRDEAMLVAAILHDVVEDTVVGLPSIERRFGDDVAALVYELTDQCIMGNRRQRKDAERARLAGISARAQTVKYADLVSNTTSIVDHDPNFARVYLTEKEAILTVMRAGDRTLLALAELRLTQGQQRLVQYALEKTHDPDTGSRTSAAPAAAISDQGQPDDTAAPGLAGVASIAR